MRKVSVLVWLALVQVTLSTYYSLDINLDIKAHNKATAMDLIENDPTIISISTYRDDRNISGWIYYYVQTSAFQPDWLQRYASGYMEGYLAYQPIYETFYDKELYNQLPIQVELNEWIQNQTTWMQNQINAHPNDNYWQLINGSLAQVDGIYEGYLAGIMANNAMNLELSYENIYYISYLGDIGYVVNKIEDDIAYTPLPHCDILVKMTDNDLICSHSTFSSYTSMLKAYKIVSYNLQNPWVNTKRISYSGVIGSVASQDDFYVIDGGHWVGATGIEPNNWSGLSYLHYESIPYWIRVVSANLCFTNMSMWTNIYYNHTSATSSGTWVLVDFNNYEKYKNNMSEAQDVVWIVEDFFYLKTHEDVTQALLVPNGYVASYNVPYNQQVLIASANPTNYTNDPRYFLFKKYAPGIQNVSDFQFVIRLNNISDTGSYCSAIAPRCDLGNTTGYPAWPFGQIDTKLTNATMVQTESAIIIVGPTTELNLPPFSWANWEQSYSNLIYGMPTLYDFNWVYLNTNVNFTTIPDVQQASEKLAIRRKQPKHKVLNIIPEKI
jgi:hypothetical protein